MDKLTKEEILNKTRDELRAKDHTIIKVNGIETTVSQYYQNPQAFNTQPMDQSFLKQVEEDHARAVEDKRRLNKSIVNLKALGEI